MYIILHIACLREDFEDQHNFSPAPLSFVLQMAASPGTSALPPAAARPTPVTPTSNPDLAVAAAHTPSLELQHKQFPGAELQYREADPDRRNWTTRAFHHTDTHLRSLSDPVLKKKTKAIVASADITSVLAEYSLHPPFLLFTIFTVSPTANEKATLFSLLFQILSAVDMTSALVECSVCFNSSFQSQKVDQMI